MNTKPLIIAILSVASLAACSSKTPPKMASETAALKNDPRNKVVEYQCAANKNIQLTFIGQNTDTVKLVLHQTNGTDSKPVMLSRRKVASGLSYSNEQFIWNSKGTEGFLQERTGKKQFKTTHNTCWLSNVSLVYPDQI